MAFEVKTFLAEGLDLLVDMRLEFIKGERPGKDAEWLAKTRASVYDYMKRQLSENRLIGYVGFEEARPVCTAAVLLYELPPLDWDKQRFQGHVLNVFTFPEFRARGYGTTLMRYLIADAKSRGIYRLFLNATKMGEPLYRKLGFHEQEERSLILPL